MKHWTTILPAAAAALFLACAARGDTLTLKTGQVLEGKVTESESEVRIKVPFATVVFERGEVAGIQYGPTSLEKYNERAKALAANDAAGHYDLGLFCEEKGLVGEAKTEFEKTIAADPNHAGARRKLGYVQKDGKWLTRDEYMTAEGYVLYRGRYVREDEARALAAQDNALARTKEAVALISTITYEIAHGRDASRQAAQDRLSSIVDPAALGPIIDATQDRFAAVRYAAVRALANYNRDEAALAALDVAFDDSDAEVRYQARLVLNKQQNEKAFHSALDALSIDNDATRFHAAEILGAIGDRRAVGSLIEFLSWTRPREVVPQGPPSVPQPAYPNVPPSYVAGVRAKVAKGVVAYEPIMGGFYYGQPVILDNRPAYERDRWQGFPAPGEDVILNYEALNALEAMTGQNFRFDKDAWRQWYMANRGRLDQPRPPRATPKGGAPRGDAPGASEAPAR